MLVCKETLKNKKIANHWHRGNCSLITKVEGKRDTWIFEWESCLVPHVNDFPSATYRLVLHDNELIDVTRGFIATVIKSMFFYSFR